MMDRITSPVDSSLFAPQIPSYLKNLIDSLHYCPQSEKAINDWKETPIYLNIMDGLSEFEAISKGYKTDDREKFLWYRAREFPKATLDESL